MIQYLPGLRFCINLDEHVVVLVVAGRCDGVMLRAVAFCEIEPTMPVSGEEDLDRILVLFQERQNAIVSDLDLFHVVERVVLKDEGRHLLFQLGFEPVQLSFPVCANRLQLIFAGLVPRGTQEVVEDNELIAFVRDRIVRVDL